jgi:hypothetical protein
VGSEAVRQLRQHELPVRALVRKPGEGDAGAERRVRQPVSSTAPPPRHGEPGGAVNPRLAEVERALFAYRSVALSDGDAVGGDAGIVADR